MPATAKKIVKKPAKTSASTMKKKAPVRKKAAKAAKPVSKAEKKTQPPEAVKVSKEKHKNYIFSVGRRKESVARARYFKSGEGEIEINGKDYKEYFPYFEYQNTILESLKETNMVGRGRFTIKVNGGGVRGQADSIRLAISKILIQIDEKFKPSLKVKKLLTTDSRVKERKKYGLKKARRAPQWQKR